LRPAGLEIGYLHNKNIAGSLLYKYDASFDNRTNRKQLLKGPSGLRENGFDFAIAGISFLKSSLH